MVVVGAVLGFNVTVNPEPKPLQVPSPTEREALYTPAAATAGIVNDSGLVVIGAFTTFTNPALNAAALQVMLYTVGVPLLTV
jgi:hypothetical protein